MIMDNQKKNIYNAIQNLYNMDFNTWQEVLSMMYNLVADTSQKFDVFEQKFILKLGNEVTKAIKELYENGKLADFINIDLFNQLNNKINKITDYIYLIDYNHLVVDNDWTIALETAIMDSINNNIALFINNGEYRLNKTISPTNDINSEIAFKNLTMIGESPLGVVFKGVNCFKGRAFDFRYMRNLYLENFTSDLNYHFIQYGTDENKIQSKRNIVIRNVYCNAGGEQINWNNYICCPKPINYKDNNEDGRYARYPLEIMNFSGYNAIMIVNKSVDEDGKIVNGGVDNSAIGITDMVKGVATPSFLIDGGMRSFMQFKNSSAESVSGEREYVVYEVDQLGRIAIGCSCQSSDPVAPGNALLKARGKYPSIKMYDHNRSNRISSFGMSDDYFNIVTCDENGKTICKIAMNYKTGTIEFKGTVKLGNILTWNDTSATKSANGISAIYVPSSITSRFEHITEGVEGQTINIVSDGVLTIEHKKDGWGNIRTNTKANIVLEKGILYTLTRINNVWYLK